MDNNFQSKLSHKLVRYGITLFLLGLLTGFVIPVMRNPRMGLASHLEAVMNGMFLFLLGLLWHKLRLSVGALKWGYSLSLFGTYTNWVANLLAAIWGGRRRNAAYCWWWLSRSSMARSAYQSWIGVFVISNDRSLYHGAVGVENKHF